MAIHSPRKLTYEDLVRFPDDGQRHEILDGEHVVTPAPMTLHQRVAFRLARRVADLAEAHDLGEVLPAPYDVVLSKHDIVELDFIFVSKGRTAIIKRAIIQGAADRMAEVLSPSTRCRDLGQKRARYELPGVFENWVCDPDTELMQVFRRAGGGLPSADLPLGRGRRPPDHSAPAGVGDLPAGGLR